MHVERASKPDGVRHCCFWFVVLAVAVGLGRDGLGHAVRGLGHGPGGSAF